MAWTLKIYKICRHSYCIHIILLLPLRQFYRLKFLQTIYFIFSFVLDDLVLYLLNCSNFGKNSSQLKILYLPQKKKHIPYHLSWSEYLLSSFLITVFKSWVNNLIQSSVPSCNGLTDCSQMYMLALFPFIVIKIACHTHKLLFVIQHSVTVSLHCFFYFY